MTSETSKITKYPEVKEARTFLQIARDFTRPLDSVREAISNAIDAHATEIHIKVWEDEKMPGGELVIEIEDNGDGMEEEGLEAFFNLGDTTRVSEDGTRLQDYIGEKGHGTKTYFNSRQIEVFTKLKTGSKFYAIMDEPLKELLHMRKPPYLCDPNPSLDMPQGTKVVIGGFNQNVKRDFAHRILRDHIMWFTKFADFSWVFEEGHPQTREESHSFAKGPKLYLHGLGYDKDWEELRYGQFFPTESTKLSVLKKKNPIEPMRWYVKCWVKKGLPVKEFPHVKMDVVFSLEGDLVRRDYNPMISYVGKPKEEGDYNITERYGLWACVDYIPIRQVNDWFSKGKSEWTRFHAFLNCQDFSLTANRADINNTDPRLLAKIEETIRDYYEENIEDSKDYEEYLAAVREEEQYRNAQQEANDFSHRKTRALAKQVAQFKGVELLAPGPSRRGERGQELGVHCLFSQVAAMQPDIFPFKVVDYDTHRGYDCLVSRTTSLDLNNPNLAFVEFKYKLEPTFNHSFSKLAYVVCWECDLNHGTEIVDLCGERRILEIYPMDQSRDHTTYYLRAQGGPLNIEVFVLKDYFKEKANIEFKPRVHHQGD